jgi:hypothetical protein
MWGAQSFLPARAERRSSGSDLARSVCGSIATMVIRPEAATPAATILSSCVSALTSRAKRAVKATVHELRPTCSIRAVARDVHTGKRNIRESSRVRKAN